MAVRLGEFLVRSRKISPDQLDRGLKAQGIFGGRLGTNLIEMGFLQEEELARFLSEKLRVPYVPPTELVNISPEVVQSISREDAAHYKVVPIRRDNLRLDMVMLNPLDLTSIDEFSFRTGFIIRPYVAPEMSILHALEKYYGVRSNRRVLTVSEALHKPLVTQRDTPAPARTDTVDFSELPELSEAAASPVAPKAGVASPGFEDRREKERLLRTLTSASSKEEVIQAVLAYVGKVVERVAFFVVKGDCALGWRAVHRAEEVTGFGSFEAKLDNSSLLRSVVDSRQCYFGAIPGTAGNLRMLDALGGRAPAMALIFPLIITGRVVAILYLDGESRLLGNSLQELQKLTNKITLAFEMLILKSKILSL